MEFPNRSRKKFIQIKKTLIRDYRREKITFQKNMEKLRREKRKY